MSLRRRIVLAGALVLLTSCTSGPKRAIEADRAEVQVNLDRARKIGASLAGIPPVTKEGTTLTGPVVMVAADKDDLPTALLVYGEDLPELSAPVEHADRLAASTILTECASLLTRGKHVTSSNPNVFENVVKSYLAKCKSVKSLFVIRTRKKEARALEGDVVVFDLASGKHQGGFPLSIQSAGRTDKATSTTTTSKTTGAGGRRRTTKTSTSTATSVNADESQLRSDLADAIDAGILKLIPTAKLPE